MQFSHMESENGNSAAKRHLGSSGGGGRDIHLKLLVPSNVSGHIIGKGGETIAEIRRTSGTHVTMSKNTEVFPGTQDRVVLINGSRDAVGDTVQMVVKLIKERLEELGDGDTDKERTVKVVVTNSTIGMVIGKGGGSVEEMKQRSGANILISKKEDQKVSGAAQIGFSVGQIGFSKSNLLRCRSV
jgi:RNA-binding protein Nova